MAIIGQAIGIAQIASRATQARPIEKLQNKFIVFIPFLPQLESIAFSVRRSS
jgi:hypothetical protein